MILSTTSQPLNVNASPPPCLERSKWLVITFTALAALACLCAGAVCLYLQVNMILSGTLLAGGSAVAIADIAASVILCKKSPSLSSPSQVSQASADTPETIAPQEELCTENELSENEKLQKNFWDTFFSPDSALHRVFQLIMVHSKGDLTTKIATVIDAYSSMLASPLSSLEKTTLCELLNQQFSSVSFTQQPEKTIVCSYKNIQLKEGVLTVCHTKGDGSCGLHALVGGPGKKAEEYSCDATKQRKEFCKWIRQQNKNGTLPNQISQVLDDYFLHWEYAPADLKTKQNNRLHGRWFKDFHKKAPHEREAACKAFKKGIFKSYLAYLKNPKHSLLQEELIAAAICFDKNLILYQPGWGTSHEPQRNTFNDAGSEMVTIWYNGYNHYERAFT